MLKHSITQVSSSSLPDSHRHVALLHLLTYAQSHGHSKRWIPAIPRLLVREEVAHG